VRLLEIINKLHEILNMWTNEIDALFRMACEEFNNEPSFRDIQDDARFKDLVEFWLFDEPFFNVCFAYFYYF
jgi:hypothetical protein